jgi:hypothetical protein
MVKKEIPMIGTGSADFRRRTRLTLLLAGVLVVTGCGDDDNNASGDAGLGGDADMQQGDGAQGSTDAAPPDSKIIGPACVSLSEDVSLSPLDMLFALDVSNSMNEGGRWNAVAAALRSFVEREDFAGLGVGMQLFPQRERCVTEAYEDPEVPIAELPGVAEAVTQVLDRGRYGAGLAGGTPLVPVLEGVLATARARAEANPDRRVVVIVATDGAPDTTCAARPDDGLPNSIQNMQTVAREGLEGSPSISTFVIGVGPGLDELSLLAAAGGSDEAVLVDRGSQGETEGAFLAALEDIRIRATACDLPMPEPPADRIEFDLETVSVKFTYGGVSASFEHISGPGECGDKPAWYFDDPEDPRRIRLCESACTFVRQRVGGKLEVVFDCVAPLV